MGRGHHHVARPRQHNPLVRNRAKHPRICRLGWVCFLCFLIAASSASRLPICLQGLRDWIWFTLWIRRQLIMVDGQRRRISTSSPRRSDRCHSSISCGRAETCTRLWTASPSLSEKGESSNTASMNPCESPQGLTIVRSGRVESACSAGRDGAGRKPVQQSTSGGSRADDQVQSGY